MKMHTPFLKIKEAAEVTGLSQYFLRQGCRNGTIPCTRSGSTYYINIPALLRQMGAEQGEGDSRAYF